MRIAYLKSASKGVHYHRLESPLSLITDRHEVSELDLYRLNVDDYDVLIFNRLPYFQPLSSIVKAQKQGLKVIVDIDDHWARPFYNSNYSVQEKQYILEIIKCLKAADVIWTSTKVLQEKLHFLGLTAHYIPNALNYEEEQFNREVYERDQLTYGWVGGTSHQYDFNQLISGLKKRKFDAQPVLGGATLTDKGDLHPYWIHMGAMLAGNPLKVKYKRAYDINNYARLYNELDIVLLPSHNDTFSQCKSNLKLLEAGAHKLPVITNGVCYKEVNGKIGLRVKDTADWGKYLTKLIDSKRMRTELGEALHEYTTKTYNIHNINELRLQTIEQ